MPSPAASVASSTCTPGSCLNDSCTFNRPDTPGAGEPDVDTILGRPECAWIDRDIGQKALNHAVAHVVPEHLADVRAGKLALIAKTEAALKDRLTKDITYWDHRAEQLKLQEQAGNPNARLHSGEARKRADLLQGRLEKRLQDLKLEARISPLPPVVLGGLVVVPTGLLSAMRGRGVVASTLPADTQASAARARAVIIEVERSLGFEPTDREFERLGYDVESRVPGTGKLRFIEVKGRVTGADTVTVTKNEILYALNKPDDFILAMVEFLRPGTACATCAAHSSAAASPPTSTAPASTSRSLNCWRAANRPAEPVGWLRDGADAV